MRFQRAVTAALVAICCADGVAGRVAIYGRQHTTDDSSLSTTDSASTPSSSRGSDSPTSTAHSSEPSSTEDAASSTVATSTPSSFATSAENAATSAITSPGSRTTGAASKESAAKPSKDQLPINPSITPALGIAGAILMCTGVALALIGIKHDWLHVFLSTALLAALSITVLVIYVMNPPVSDAVQGAYFVAALLTGLILGALSLVFKEITEGLGCLLGGFCLAMWFLVLRPGGLVGSTSGRAVLIAVFCLVCLALSFSRYTRNYGLILCTSFAGATATILGVDCFSRAGMKEFWLYLWNLNDDIFPLGTYSYPITKGIRVEIAGIVVVFVFGVMSQFKIWKVVKERRQRQDAERLRDDEDRDQLESRVGKEIEHANRQDREQWEAVYGDKEGKRQRANTDSGVGSSVDSFRKGPASVQERELGAVELVEMPAHQLKRASKADMNGTVTVNAISEEDLSHGVAPSQENLLETMSQTRPASQMSNSCGSLREKTSHASQNGEHDDYHDDAESQSAAATPGPQVVPLPFSPPVEEFDNEDKHSVSSRGTAGRSIRTRIGMKLNKLTLKRKEEQERGSMIIPRIEDDRASSIAATAADERDDASRHRLSVLTMNQRNPSRDSLMVQSTEGKSRPVSIAATSIGEKPLDEKDDEALAPPDVPDVANEALDTPTTKVEKKRESRSKGGRRRASDPGEDDAASVAESLSGHLTQKLSKVAMAYRTNEWAKHITDADTPEVVEDDEEPHSPGVQVDTEFAKEAAKPVDVHELQAGTLLEDGVPGPKRQASKRPSHNTFKRSSSTGNLLTRNASSSGKTPVYAIQRSESQLSMRRQANTPSMAVPQTLNRMSSVPLISQPLVESPIEEDRIAPPGPYLRNTMSPTMGSSGNLMDQRNTMLRHKPTTQSFMAPSSSTANLISVTAPSDSGSSRNVPISDTQESEEVLPPFKSDVDEEDMTLAQRKELMALRAADQQRQQTPSPALLRHGSNPANFSRRTSYNLPGPLSRQNSVQATSGAIYDSHQPKRSNTVDQVKQNAMMTQWRTSLQHEASVKQPAIAEESARQHLLSERRQKEWQQQRQAAERNQRESVMDMAMRTGQLHGAHQDAMRRMQAKANKNG
ncbi:hypothetical protein K431DRAFT_304869 [Polychaeton citri CBS 116435]|uniref:TM7S3/TM198-like domain-containing protein n=1 Tax=Polychaeton citri CBS 116435 TaxID=1314669 RepID=A0A9P4UNK2_9PEZI|nr:hypothetical protein K431DRAFT_304869 [Polychaeton citri CBS 116435]